MLKDNSVEILIKATPTIDDGSHLRAELFKYSPPVLGWTLVNMKVAIIRFLRGFLSPLEEHPPTHTQTEQVSLHRARYLTILPRNIFLCIILHFYGMLDNTVRCNGEYWSWMLDFHTGQYFSNFSIKRWHLYL